MIRAVVVDDHPMARDWTSRSLAAAADIDVLGAAEDGLTGLRLTAELRPDVLVLDVHLPDISGIEVARRVRTALPDTAILIVTGFDDSTYAQALLQIGVRGYITKSASAGEIIEAVREAAQGHTVVRSDASKAAVQEVEQPLTARDRQLLTLLASGRRNLEIASALDVSLNVVEYRVGQLLQTLGARSRAEAIHLAAKRGLIPPTTSFVDGLPSTPPLKVYHGHRGASGGRYTVQVQEQQEFRLLVHACKAHGAKDCQSPSGWDYGFGAFGGVELARWLLADCLGMAYLHHKELHYAFKSTFLNRLPPGDWTLSEAEIRCWADDRGVVGPTDQDQELNP